MKTAHPLLSDPSIIDRSLLHAQQFIAGEFCDAADGATTPITDPSTGDHIADVSWGTPADVDDAVEAARRAQQRWAATAPTIRSQLLRRWFDLIIANREHLARLMTSELGKPIREARGEVAYGAAFIEWYAEEAKRINGEILASNAADRRLLVRREPVGVAAAITPWNFPLAMITRKAAPALAAGCAVVIKPAPETPLTALAMADLARRAELPAGVMNVVPGGGPTVGNALATHADVRVLSFTGSTAVGKELMAAAAGNVKHIALELGGNAPVIVFDDADLDAAVEGALASKFRNAGQTCVCANRILVHERLHDDFVAAFVRCVEQLRVGSGHEEDVDQGPLVNEAAVAKVTEHIDDAVGAGALLATGGKRHRLGRTFFEPTVLTGVAPDMKISREETFGPVAPVSTFGSDDEAVALANATTSGLAAYAFTNDLNRFWRVSERLEFGIVAVNTGVFSYEGAPFGGMKESGLGREGSHHGLDEYLETKYVCLGGVG